MGYTEEELFEQDLSNMNYIQLADWIESCRSVVNRNEFNSDEEFEDTVTAFCEIWYRHYLENTKEYKKDKFSRALHFLEFRKRAFVKCKYQGGQFELPYCNLQNMFGSLFKEKTLEAVKQEASYEYCQILNVFNANSNKINLNEEDCTEIKSNFDLLVSGNYQDNSVKGAVENPKFKEKLHYVIVKQHFSNLEVNVRCLKDNTLLEAVSFNDFMKKCSDERNLKIDVDSRYKKSSCFDALKEYGVTKNAFTEYLSPDKCEKEFDKKLFVNLAFALSLSYPLAERLLSYGGYTINSPFRSFDIICKKAFQVGFSRDMTIAIINKKNREAEKMSATYAPIPSLIITKKNK